MRSVKTKTAGDGTASMSDAPDPSETLDRTELVGRLVEAEVLTERADGQLVARPEFERVHDTYRRKHRNTDDEAFRDAIADAFWIDPEEAAARIEETGVTRAELAAYEALRAFLDDDPETVELASMAAIVVGANPPSPVPDALTELDDETYEPYLDAHPDVVVFAWKRDCPPCEAMKEELGDILDALPDDHAVAGVDGGLSAGFRAEFDLTVAPSVLCFRGGDPVETAEGRQRPDDVAALVERVYGA